MNPADWPAVVIMGRGEVDSLIAGGGLITVMLLVCVLAPLTPLTVIVVGSNWAVLV